MPAEFCIEQEIAEFCLEQAIVEFCMEQAAFAEFCEEQAIAEFYKEQAIVVLNTAIACNYIVHLLSPKLNLLFSFSLKFNFPLPS